VIVVAQAGGARRLVALSCAMLIAGCSAGTTPPGSARRRSTPEVPAPTTRPATGSAIERIQLPSLDKGGGTRQVAVYRPPGVPDSASLPVVYYLHGLPGFAGDAFILPGLQKEVSTGAPFVLVAPDGKSPYFLDSEWADSYDGRQRIETWVATVLIPRVEGKHRRPARLRAITGYSMGGYGAINIGLHHPELFGEVVQFAGYDKTDDRSAVFGRDTQTLRRNTPDRNVAAGKNRDFLLMEGTGDRGIIKGEAVRMGKLLRAAGARTTVRVIPGGHGPGTLGRGWPLIVDWLRKKWATPVTP
jgi:enterochelin esterase-like enzyme